MNIEDWQVIAQIFVTVSTASAVLIRLMVTNTGLKKLRDEVLSMSGILNQVYNKDVIKTELSDIIQNKAIEGIRNNSLGHETHKDIIMNWASQFEKFSHDVYLTKYRGTSSFDEYIGGRIGGVISEAEHLTKYTFKGRVTLDGVSVGIIDYLEGRSSLYDEIKNLIFRLKKNGLTNEAYVALFGDFTQSIVSELAKGLQKWHKINQIKQNGTN